MKKSVSGFTLVELLIVIVVIAILAAISIVAYNGIVDRAISAKTAMAIDNYSKHLQLTYAEEGKFQKEAGTGFSESCLGSVANYPATDVFPAGVCVMNVSTSTPLISVRTEFYNETVARLSTAPEVPADKTVTIENTNPYTGVTTSKAYRGVWVQVNPLLYYRVELALPASKECPSNTDKVGIYPTAIWCQKYVEV